MSAFCISLLYLLWIGRYAWHWYAWPIQCSDITFLLSILPCALLFIMWSCFCPFTMRLDDFQCLPPNRKNGIRQCIDFVSVISLHSQISSPINVVIQSNVRAIWTEGGGIHFRHRYSWWLKNPSESIFGIVVLNIHDLKENNRYSFWQIEIKKKQLSVEDLLERRFFLRY